MKDLRIVSFLPSATELACDLGLGDQLVGISHECDYPPSLANKPVVVHSAIPAATMTPRQIDTAVSERLRRGESLYAVDEELLRSLEPTHILTQDLCQVCAPAGNEVSRALRALPHQPEVLWMSPHSIADIHNDLRNLAHLTGTLHRAEELICTDLARIDVFQSRVAGRQPLRVFCAEWTDPLYCCGHWVPEQVEMAGGHDPLGRKWKDSVRVKLEEVTAARPEALIVISCGFSLDGCMEQARDLTARSEAQDWPAVYNDRVYAVDASYFSPPTRRVVDGIELLANLFLGNDDFQNSERIAIVT
ncbi:MAG TPA: cobalamin-binding protein [Methylomirabilota bacterium]|nr:cobalamin-binding protein [Methylomirabilota bacterium]